MAANLDRMRAAVNLDVNVAGTEKVAGLTGAMAAANAETARMTKAQSSMAKQLQYTTDTFGKTRSEVLQYRANMIGAGDALNPIIANLKRMGIDGENSFKKVITQSRVFTQVMHIPVDLITGDWSRIGEAAFLMAEKFEISGFLLSAFGLAAFAAGGGVIAFVAAVIEGERESTRFANAISLTGGMAGITEGQFRDMAAAIGQDVPGAASLGRNALMDLIATGKFSGTTLEAVGRAATEMASYTGESAADVVKHFDDMKGNAAAWAAKMNESYHFLSLAQYDYIKQLQDQGQTEAAEKAAADDLYTSLAVNGTHNLGLLENAWNDVTGAVEGAFSAMEDVGRTSTIEQQIASLQAQNVKTRYGVYENPQINGQIAALQKQLTDQQAMAAGTAHTKQVQQAGIDGANALDALTNEFLTPVQKLKRDVADARKALMAEIAADPNGAKTIADRAGFKGLVANITRRDTPGGASAPLNKPDANGYVVGADDLGKVSTQITLMTQYASATHKTESAVLALSLAQGKLNGFTRAQVAEIKQRAAADDKLAAAKAAQNAADKATALQGKYTDAMGGLSDQRADLQMQIDQMSEYGIATKQAALNAVNLQIAQNKLAGLPQSELDSLRKAASEVDEMQAKLLAYSRTGAAGTQSAFKDYVDNATDAGAQMKQIWTDTFSGMEDILVTALEGGKVSFGSFALTVINDMLKMEVEERILGPLLASLGGGGSGGGILGSLFGAIGSGFGSGGGMSTASLVSHQGGASSLLGSFGSFLSSEFADGGVMTSRGRLRLNRYANGGVATSPQMAMFGEGRTPEAYVPLPDGRSIPVSMKGAGGGQVNNHFTINADGSTGDGDNARNASAMNRAIIYTIQKELIKQHRDGGIFSSTSRR